jgi:hypothetical protein
MNMQKKRNEFGAGSKLADEYREQMGYGETIGGCFGLD